MPPSPYSVPSSWRLEAHWAVGASKAGTVTHPYTQALAGPAAARLNRPTRRPRLSASPRHTTHDRPLHCAAQPAHSPASR